MRRLLLPSLPPGPARRRVALGLGLATVILGAWLVLREDEPASPPPSESGPAIAELAEAPVEPVLPPRPLDPRATSTLPRDCDALATRASEGGPDAVLLAWLCPAHPLDAVAARAALLAVRSPDEAAALVPRLSDHPPLQGLLRLVVQAPAAPVSALPDPTAVVVSPIDDQVLSQVQRAHALVAARGITPTERTRARALLAKTYLQATQQLGVGVGRPPEPFARLLAGRALHYGRALCLTYLQSRVGGLAPLFQEVETHLLDLVIALEASPHHDDAARLAVELDETRRYLQREGPRDRIARRNAERSSTPVATEQLRPLPDDIARLLDHGLVDLAVARALEAAGRSEGPGLRPMEQLLRDALARAERGEYVALLEHRLARARARTPPPPEHGPTLPGPASEPSWPAPGSVADEAAAWIEQAPVDPGLPRRYALGRALLLVRARPDALVLLLDHATAEDASPALRQALGWLTTELAARDDGRLSWLQRRVAAEPDPTLRADDGTDSEARHQAEAARRRRFALRMREAERLPRGPGLADVTG
jgi:hypothetical protein